MERRDATIKITEEGNLHIHIPMFIRKKSGRKMIYALETLEGTNEIMPALPHEHLAELLIQGFLFTDLIEKGVVKSRLELSRKISIDRSRIGKLMRLTTLAPDIIEAILKGHEPAGLTPVKLIRQFPEEWEEQRKWFGVK